MTLLIFLASSFGYAQDKIHSFESSQLKINYKGQPIETSTTNPSTIKVDIEAGTMTQNTKNAEVREVLGDQVVFATSLSRWDKCVRNTAFRSVSFCWHISTPTWV